MDYEPFRVSYTAGQWYVGSTLSMYPPRGEDHMGNFIDCVRSRKPTVCPPEVGHRSGTVCHIGNIAVRTGKKLRWDPEKQRFDDEEANKWLSRELRAPWKLEA